MEKLVSYLKKHESEVAMEVDKEIVDKKDSIKNQILEEIRKYVNPLTMHIECEYDGTPYDYSGVLVEKEYINTNQTILEFLQNEYSGHKSPTFANNYGWYYETYGDEISGFIDAIGGELMESAIKRHLENVFQIEISDDVINDIECNYCDSIRDNSMALMFWFYEELIDFLEIGEITLIQLIEGC